MTTLAILARRALRQIAAVVPIAPLAREQVRGLLEQHIPAATSALAIERLNRRPPASRQKVAPPLTEGELLELHRAVLTGAIPPLHSREAVTKELLRAAGIKPHVLPPAEVPAWRVRRREEAAVRKLPRPQISAEAVPLTLEQTCALSERVTLLLRQDGVARNTPDLWYRRELPGGWLVLRNQCMNAREWRGMCLEPWDIYVEHRGKPVGLFHRAWPEPLGALADEAGFIAAIDAALSA